MPDLGVHHDGDDLGADPAGGHGRGPQPLEELGSGLATGVGVTAQEGVQLGRCEFCGGLRGRETVQERERDPCLDVLEQPGRSRPVRFQQGP